MAYAPRAQISSDGTTVWVNAYTGECLARFGRLGIDVHRAVADQAQHGECLYCTHTPTTAADYEIFKAEVKKFHGIVIPKKHTPRRFAR